MNQGKAVLTPIVRIKRIKPDICCARINHRLGELEILRKCQILFVLSVPSAPK